MRHALSVKKLNSLQQDSHQVSRIFFCVVIFLHNSVEDVASPHVVHYHEEIFLFLEKI